MCESHQALVFAAFELPDGPYRGEEVVTSVATDGCLARLPAELESRDDLALHYLYPQREGWYLGDHQVTCLVAAGSGTLTQDLTTVPPDLGA